MLIAKAQFFAQFFMGNNCRVKCFMPKSHLWAALCESQHVKCLSLLHFLSVQFLNQFGFAIGTCNFSKQGQFCMTCCDWVPWQSFAKTGSVASHISIWQFNICWRPAMHRWKTHFKHFNFLLTCHCKCMNVCISHFLTSGRNFTVKSFQFVLSFETFHFSAQKQTVFITDWFFEMTTVSRSFCQCFKSIFLNCHTKPKAHWSEQQLNVCFLLSKIQWHVIFVFNFKSLKALVDIFDTKSTAKMRQRMFWCFLTLADFHFAKIRNKMPTLWLWQLHFCRDDKSLWSQFLSWPKWNSHFVPQNGSVMFLHSQCSCLNPVFRKSFGGNPSWFCRDTVGQLTSWWNEKYFCEFLAFRMSPPW